MKASIRKDNKAPGPGEVPARVKDFMAYAAVNGYAVGFYTPAPEGDRDAGYYLIHEQRPDGLVNHGDTFRIRLDVLETILMDAASEYQEAGVGIVFKCLHAFRYHPGKLAHLEGAKVREDEPPWMAWWSAFRMGYDRGREVLAAMDTLTADSMPSPEEART